MEYNLRDIPCQWIPRNIPPCLTRISSNFCRGETEEREERGERGEREERGERRERRERRGERGVRRERREERGRTGRGDGERRGTEEGGGEESKATGIEKLFPLFVISLAVYFTEIVATKPYAQWISYFNVNLYTPTSTSSPTYHKTRARKEMRRKEK
jgi:hypothetical protein